MAEPFTGDHWGKGYDEEVKRGWTDSESEDDYMGSDGSDRASPGEVIITPSSDRAFSAQDLARMEKEMRIREGEERLERAVDVLKGLDEAYWRTGGEVVEGDVADVYGWRDVSTSESGQKVDMGRGLMAEVNAASLAQSLKGSKRAFKLISALDLQRELLVCLSGRSGVMLRFQASGKCSVSYHK